MENDIIKLLLKLFPLIIHFAYCCKLINNKLIVHSKFLVFKLRIH